MPRTVLLGLRVAWALPRGLTQGCAGWLHVTNLAEAALDAVPQPAGLGSALFRASPALPGPQAGHGERGCLYNTALVASAH